MHPRRWSRPGQRLRPVGGRHRLGDRARGAADGRHRIHRPVDLRAPVEGPRRGRHAAAGAHPRRPRAVAARHRPGVHAGRRRRRRPAHGLLPRRRQLPGHPALRDAGADPARLIARQALGIRSDATVLAMLPGSRNSEVELMIEHFLGAAALFAEQTPDTVTVIPCVRPAIRERVETALQAYPKLVVKLYEGNARQALVACDVALVKSGTSTLEAMLLHRPMVVSYRLGWWTYQLAKRVLRTPYVALPNILAGRPLVPELLQHEGTAQALAQALQQELHAAAQDAENTGAFEQLHQQLRQGADAKSAASVLRLLAENTTGS